MNRLPSHVSALALFPVRASRQNRPGVSIPLVGDTRLVGAAVLSHTVTASGKLVFSLRCKSLAIDEPEIELTNWLKDELTMPGLLVGYGLYNCVLPLLQSLIRPGEHYSLGDLTAAPPHRLHDLARAPGSFTPTPFESACAQQGIDVVGPDPEQDDALFRASLTDAVDHIVMSRAISTWRLWLNDFAMATGEEQLCNHAAACLDAELRLHPLPTADALGRPFPTTAK